MADRKPRRSIPEGKPRPQEELPADEPPADIPLGAPASAPVSSGSNETPASTNVNESARSCAPSLEAGEDSILTTEGSETGAAAEHPLTAQLQQLEEELKETRDRLLRAHAELDNYRKRAARELEDQRRYAELTLLRDLIPVLDNMHRAVQAAQNATDPQGLIQGFQMVTAQLEEVLARHHCLRIEAEGQPFEPHFHEAVAQEHSTEVPANTVLRVLQQGYRLFDRVVRPARVVVCSGPPPSFGSATRENQDPNENKKNLDPNSPGN